ncbi:hypothetical protein P3T43_004308 [Paraburkholderia sp. GAS41]
MDERERLERNRSPYDPAAPGESATLVLAQLHGVVAELPDTRGRRSVCIDGLTVC